MAWQYLTNSISGNGGRFFIFSNLGFIVLVGVILGWFMNISLAFTYMFVIIVMSGISLLAGKPKPALFIYDAFLAIPNRPERDLFCLPAIAVLAVIGTICGYISEPLMWKWLQPDQSAELAKITTHALVSFVISFLFVIWHMLSMHKTINMSDGRPMGRDDIERVLDYIQQETAFGRGKTRPQVLDALIREVLRGRIRMWGREKGKSTNIQMFPKKMRHCSLDTRRDQIIARSQKENTWYRGFKFRRKEIMALWPPLDTNVDW